MRTLIIAPDSLADAVMAQSLAALLQQQAPEAQIAVLAGPEAAPVCACYPGLARLLSTEVPFEQLSVWALLRWARTLRAFRHDRVFLLSRARRAAWLLGLTGIRRVHRLEAGQPAAHIEGSVDTRAVPARPLTVERFAQLAFEPGQPLPGPVTNPVLRPDPIGLAAMHPRLGMGRSARILALCVAAEAGPAHRWPSRHWASLITQIREIAPRLTPVLLGHSADRDFGTEIAALCGGAAVNLCGGARLTDTLGLIAQAEAVVSHDCGLMHAAAAFGRPLVALYGPSDPRTFPPRSARARVLWQPMRCSACTDPVCQENHGQCLAAIRPETALSALLDSLGRLQRDIR